MKDRIFIDTNILIYSVSKGDYRCEMARKLLIDNADLIVISSQVINEFINISIKKGILLPEKAYNYALNFMEIFDFIPIDKREIEKAIFIKQKYKYSYWDSLIISCALISGCNILYTEDLHHNQKVEENLIILNPFKF